MRQRRAARLVLCLLAVLCLPLTSVIAEGNSDGAWKPIPVGTKAIYNYGESWEVIAIDGSKIILKGDRSNQAQDVVWYKHKGMFNSIGDSGAVIKFDPEAIDKLFPIKIGNKTTISASIEGWKWKLVYKVTKFKEVDTLLGRRSVFVIAFAERGDDNYKAKGWGYYDAEFGFWHRGTYAWGDNDPVKWKLLHLEIPE